VVGDGGGPVDPQGKHSSRSTSHAFEYTSQPGDKSFAILGEYARDHNVLAKGGVNRRVLNVVEAQRGKKIRLLGDGCVRLREGLYRVNGFSFVSVQNTTQIVVPKFGTNYPGYVVVYERQYESDPNIRYHLLAIGSASVATDMSQSHYDAVLHVDRKHREGMVVCLGHQAGDNLHDEVFLSLYDIDGISSEQHVMARMAIFEL